MHERSYAMDGSYFAAIGRCYAVNVSSYDAIGSCYAMIRSSFVVVGRCGETIRTNFAIEGNGYARMGSDAALVLRLRRPLTQAVLTFTELIGRDLLDGDKKRIRDVFVESREDRAVGGAAKVYAGASSM